MVWLQEDSNRLSASAASAIRRASRGGLAVAAFTQWELARLTHTGRLQLAIPAQEWLERMLADIRILPLTIEVALLAARFGTAYPADPGDRIIGATALAHGLTLVTADERIRASGMVRTLW